MRTATASFAAGLILLSASCRESADSGKAAFAPATAGEISACVDLCMHLAAACPAKAKSCAEACPALPESRRECLKAASDCAAVTACAEKQPTAAPDQAAAHSRLLTPDAGPQERPAAAVGEGAAPAKASPVTAKPDSKPKAASCSTVCKNMKSACPMAAIGCSMTCSMISQEERDCLASAKSCDETDACAQGELPSGQKQRQRAKASSRVVRVDSKQIGGGCPKPLRSSSSPGFSCGSGEDCQQFCCACNSSGWPRFAASACVDGECADEETACSEALERSSHCR